ncbi:MAG: hypothetical protein OQL08_13330 [Gammaproteobacteria bacterium]|nr:hypothetical protein [Gammaproteobacteria bacterium]
MEITLLLNEPLGGRCRLYRTYATALVEDGKDAGNAAIAITCSEQFTTLPTHPELHAPAMLIDGLLVAPADGVILSPQDIAQALAPLHPEAPRLEALLQEVLERCMEEWG